MKNLLHVILILTVVSSAFGQIEKGDKEISFMGYYGTYISSEDDAPAYGFGSVQISYSKFISPLFQVGIAPNINFSTMEDQDGETTVKARFSGSVFFNLNFSNTSKVIPYITGRFYQMEFDIPENAEFSDYSYAQMGFGIKNFINEYAALNMLGTWGFSLAEDAEGGMLMLMVGLSFIF